MRHCLKKCQLAPRFILRHEILDIGEVFKPQEIAAYSLGVLEMQKFVFNAEETKLHAGPQKLEFKVLRGRKDRGLRGIPRHKARG